MDVVKEYVDVLTRNINACYDAQHDILHDVADMFGQCMQNGGIVQLFGSNNGVEFCNELNYRAGGIAYYHAYRLQDLALKHVVTKQETETDGEAYNNTALVDEFEKIYQLDDRDMYCLISERGNEPLVIEIARRAKAKGQKVVAFVNKSSYDKYQGTLLDYADLWVDFMSDDPDVALNINGVAVGQTNTTVANVMAQMLHAEVYRYYVERGLEAPVLLSANIKGADVHNNGLTDPYERRIR